MDFFLLGGDRSEIENELENKSTRERDRGGATSTGARRVALRRKSRARFARTRGKTLVDIGCLRARDFTRRCAEEAEEIREKKRRRRRKKNKAHTDKSRTYTLLLRRHALGPCCPRSRLPPASGEEGPAGRRDYPRSVLISFAKTGTAEGREGRRKTGTDRFWHFALSQWHEHERGLAVSPSDSACALARARARTCVRRVRPSWQANEQSL